MGRLITPISKEEWDKLPNWQKWMSNHGPLLLIVLILSLLFIGMILFK